MWAYHWHRIREIFSATFAILTTKFDVKSSTFVVAPSSKSKNLVLKCETAATRLV